MRSEQSGKLRVNLCLIYFDAKVINEKMPGNEIILFISGNLTSIFF